MRALIRQRTVRWVSLGAAVFTIVSLVAPSSALATTRVFYVDSQSGSDSYGGTSTSRPWRTLSRVESASIRAGDHIRFRRDRTWGGQFDIKWSGTSSAPIVIEAYGTGALPVFTSGNSCIEIPASYVVVRYVRAQGCKWAGIDVRGDHVRVEHSYATGNSAGVAVMQSSYGSRVLHNTIVNNRSMHVLTQGGYDDSGAFGVLVQGDKTEVAYNRIDGHDAFSYDYGRDGSAVEIYGGRWTHVHHNRATNNRTFTELGDPRAGSNTFAYNVVRSSLTDSNFVITRGAESGWGPIYKTRLYNNTVMMTGDGTEGFICHAGCNKDILILRNNIIRAAKKCGYADGPVDSAYNLYWTGTRQFTLGSYDKVADPKFYSSTDLRLRSGSPAINSGIDLNYSFDVLRQSLVSRTDRGAYEYQG
jgi:hypothetical protein